MTKAIQHSVGMGGCNNWQDVATVQYLLNCIPASEGGPIGELVIDGQIGPLTMSAIRRFQQSIGLSDGRVDSKGPTFQSLAAYDPMPETNIADSFSKGSKGNFSPDYKGKFPFAKGGKAPYVTKGDYEGEEYDEWAKGAGKHSGKHLPGKGEYSGGKGDLPGEKYLPGKMQMPDYGKGGYLPGKGTYPGYGKLQDPLAKGGLPGYGKLPGKGYMPGGKGGGGKGII